VSCVSLDTFAGVDYVALGHLHGRQTLCDAVRYSGSPLAYSFSETTHRKGSWLVDLGPTGLHSVAFVDAPVPRPLARIRGTLESLLTDAHHAVAEAAWVEATLTDTCRPPHALERLKARFPHALVLRFEPLESSKDSSEPLRSKVVGRSDLAVISHFFTDMRGCAPTGAETALLRDACDACRIDEDLAAS
jgi:exonuclease SbcD